MTINLSAQYTPLHLDIGTYWKVDAYNSVGSGIGNLEIKSESLKDTSISGNTYYVIRTITKHTGFNIVYYPVDYYTYLRNDTANKKVYAYINGNDSLIYDFDMTIGDSLYSTIQNGWGSDINIDTIYTATYYGVNRKVIATKDTFGNIQRKLIEGLGSEFGFIAYSYDPGFENGAFTKCIKFNGTTLYGDSSISCDLALGISELKSNFDLKVFPNPTTNRITIETKENTMTPYNIELKTIYGNTIINKQTFLNTEILNLENLPTGIYLLAIKSSNKLKVERIIKQ